MINAVSLYLRSNLLQCPPIDSPKNLKDYFDGVWGVPTKKEKPGDSQEQPDPEKPYNSVFPLVHRLLSSRGGLKCH